MPSGQWATSTRNQQLPNDWPRTRRRILHRDNHTCQSCGKPATDVDHINRGPNHNDTNLQALCSRCHSIKSAHEGVQARAKLQARTKRQPEPHPGLID